MLDEKDLQAIAKIVGESETRIMAKTSQMISDSEDRLEDRIMKKTSKLISESEDRIMAKTSKLNKETETRLMAMTSKLNKETEARLTAMVSEQVNDAERRMMALMEGFFNPKFNLLADQLKVHDQKMITTEKLEKTEARIDVLEAVVRQHSHEIGELKKAQ